MALCDRGCKLFDQQAVEQWEAQMAQPVRPGGDLMWGGGFDLAIRRPNE